MNLIVDWFKDTLNNIKNFKSIMNWLVLGGLVSTLATSEQISKIGAYKFIGLLSIQLVIWFVLVNKEQNIKLVKKSYKSHKVDNELDIELIKGTLNALLGELKVFEGVVQALLYCLPMLFSFLMIESIQEAIIPLITLQVFVIIEAIYTLYLYISHIKLCKSVNEKEKWIKAEH